jgi:hypothetical protein
MSSSIRTILRVRSRAASAVSPLGSTAAAGDEPFGAGCCAASCAAVIDEARTAVKNNKVVVVTRELVFMAASTC